MTNEKLIVRPEPKVVTYVPDNSVRHGYISLVADIARELVQNRWLTYQLFKRDMVAFYKQSLLGAVWLFLVPLITIGTFVLLSGSGVVSVGEINAPYPIFAGLGVAVWTIFSQGLVAGANSLVSTGELISRVNFSKKSLVIASMGRTLVSFIALVALVVALFAVYLSRGYDYTPTAAALLAPLALVPVLLLTMGISFYLALLNSIVRDIGTVLGVVVTFVMFLTPVLYARPRVPANAGALAQLLSDITSYNPLYYLVAAPRELILVGRISNLDGFLASSGLALGLFLAGLFGFHLTETRIAERI